MTTNDDHASPAAATDHHADAHDHFDPEPAASLSAGETPSPAWLPILGAGVFLIGGTYFLATPSAPEPAAATSASASASAAVAPVASVARPAAPKPSPAEAMQDCIRQLAQQGALPVPSASAFPSAAAPTKPPAPGASGQPQAGHPPPHPAAPPPPKPHK